MHLVLNCCRHAAAPTCSLALLIPAAQSSTADYNPAERRGRAFGLLYMTGALGALLGAVFATNVGGLRPLGTEGWRFAFGAVALASWAIGACTLALGVDPRFSQDPCYRWAGGCGGAGVRLPMRVRAGHWRRLLAAHGACRPAKHSKTAQRHTDTTLHSLQGGQGGRHARTQLASHASGGVGSAAHPFFPRHCAAGGRRKGEESGAA